MTNNHKRQRGFTIIELLIATAVFSVVLVVFLTAVLRVSQLFYKGVNMARTQETARNVVQTISDDVQFYKGAPEPSPPSDYFCIGTHRYTWYPGEQVQSTGPDLSHGIVRDDVSGCPAPGGGGANAVQLLDPGMQANWLEITPLPNDSVGVLVHIVFYGGDNSVLESPSHSSPAWKAADAICSGPANSTQYCATAHYKSTVLQRF